MNQVDEYFTKCTKITTIYNQYERIFFTKVIKNDELEGLGWGIYRFIKRGGGAQAHKVKLQNYLFKSR